MSNGGFNPDRLQSKRDGPVIPQILSSEAATRAKGFTEIKVVGIGGAGGNTVDRMMQTGVQGIDFITVNCDMQALEHSQARTRVRIGERITRGLGTGGDVKLGARAAEAAQTALEEALSGADMVFLTAGLGGGTGTGAAPIVAHLAQAAGALTVGVVTLPFTFEGSRRKARALEGLEHLRPALDASIVISNDRLLQIAPHGSGIVETLRLADETLNQGIRGIADLILVPGLINLDYADVRSIMSRAGPTLMAMGTGTGENRAIKAAQQAIASPLLDTTIDGARGILLNITGGPDLGLYEVNQAASLIADAAAPDCNIIFGTVLHPKLSDEIRITIIATGFRED